MHLNIWVAHVLAAIAHLSWAVTHWMGIIQARRILIVILRVSIVWVVTTQFPLIWVANIPVVSIWNVIVWVVNIQISIWVVIIRVAITRVVNIWVAKLQFFFSYLIC